jgi:hypothetical protein
MSQNGTWPFGTVSGACGALGKRLTSVPGSAASTGPDPLVHRRPEPCIPAAIPDLQAEPVAVLAQAAVLIAQLGVIGRRVAEHAAAADATEACERSLVVEDTSCPEHCRDLLVDDREEPLGEPMRFVAIVEHRLVERAALGVEGGW